MHIYEFGRRAFAFLLSAVFSVALAVGRWLFRGVSDLPHLEHVPRLERIVAAAERFKAFVSRALAHPGYVAGGFYPERSIA